MSSTTTTTTTTVLSHPATLSVRGGHSHSSSSSSSNGAKSEDASPLYFCFPDDEPYGFMSQWYMSPFDVEGVRYESAEMYMMVQKAVLFDDAETLAQMRAKTLPGDHQALGRQVRGFVRSVWDEHKSRIVEEGNWYKFTRCREKRMMVQRLCATGERQLVEASDSGRIWSIGFDTCDAEANRERWGENRMGIALMRTRERLRREGYV